MMKTRYAFAGLALLLTLAACGEEKGPGGLSPEEERGLDNAASMLNEPNNIAVPDDSMVADENEIMAEEQANGGEEIGGNRQ
jgi:predicted small lipoprotein YifL